MQGFEGDISASRPDMVAALPKPATVIRLMTDSDATAWNDFVLTAPEATFFHRAEWRAIFENVFHLKTHYWVAERSGQIVGVLPLVQQRSVLFGNALVAAPFCVEGGPVAKDAQARDALDQTAIELFERTRANYIEFRSRIASRPDWQVRRGLYAHFARPITGDDNQNLLAIPGKQRRIVRHALSGSFRGEVDDDPKRLFQVYSETMRNYGTPMFPRNYFVALQHAFGNDCNIIVITEGGKALSAAMTFYFRDSVMPFYVGGTAAARRNGAYVLLYWEVMRRAAAIGYRRFDFGRSKAGTGPFAFKKNWGFEPSWLEYEYWVRPGTALPEKHPLNPKYALFIAAWKRLPLPVANALGPLLIRNLG